MEPFGLFDLLKTLLPDPPEKKDTAPSNDAPPSTNTPAQTAETPPNYDRSNACWDFMTRHDERAKNAKNTRKTPR